MIASLVLALLFPQEPQLSVRGPQPAVVRLGDSAQVDVVVQDALQGVTIEVPKVDGLRIQTLGPQSSEQMIYAAGRMNVQRSTTYQLHLTPQREAKFTIPPFAVRAGGKTMQTRAIVLEAVRDIRGQERGYLSIRPQSRTVYVHEPIRFEIEMGIDEKLPLDQGHNDKRQPAANVRLDASWLQELPGSVRLANADKNGDLVVMVNDEWVWTQLNAIQREGKTYNRFKFERAFLSSQVGKLELGAPVLRFVVQTGRTRTGIFGEQIGGAHENLYVYGEPMTLEVKALPETGRPANFAGAVGRFVLEAKADRTKVKVGNSVKLTLSIQGSGNTEFLRVPELDALDGFHLRGKTEKRSADGVDVVYDLAPLRADVKQIPAIPWTYFDTRPGVERYVELQTQPIALEVQPLAEGESLRALPGNDAKAIVPGVDDIFDLADRQGPPVTPPRPLPAGLVLGLVAVPWLLAGVLRFAARRLAAARADVRGARARGASRRFAAAVAKGAPPVDALVGYLADRMGVEPAAVIEPELARRLRDAGVAEALAAEVQAALEAGVAGRYGGAATLEPATAQALVERLERESWSDGRRALSPALVLLAALATAGSGFAQDPAAEGTAAYRRGDYAAAARAFARALEAPDADRRLHYDLGNAQYRLGEYALAMHSYERARLALPRDPELQANLALTRRKLELETGSGEPFLAALAQARDAFTSRELLGLALALHGVAALGLLLVRRTKLARVAGLIALVPALALTAELALLRPTRPPAGIVLQNDTRVVAEPRAGLEPLMKLRAGVKLAVLGEGEGWTQVLVNGRRGYVPAAQVGVVR